MLCLNKILKHEDYIIILLYDNNKLVIIKINELLL